MKRPSYTTADKTLEVLVLHGLIAKQVVFIFLGPNTATIGTIIATLSTRVTTAKPRKKVCETNCENL